METIDTLANQLIIKDQIIQALKEKCELQKQLIKNYEESIKSYEDFIIKYEELSERIEDILTKRLNRKDLELKQNNIRKTVELLRIWRI